MAHKRSESGLGLIEVSVALLIFLIGLLALAQAVIGAVIINTKSRDLTRVSTMCKDKAEQLMSLGFDDISTNTTVEPSGDPLIYPATGGFGLACTGTPCIGGSIAPNPPVTGYVDFLDIAGRRVPQAQARFTRQWRITRNGNIKVIEVTVKGDPRAFSYQSARVVTYKSN